MKTYLILATSLAFMTATSAQADAVCADKPVLEAGKTPSLFFWNTRLTENLSEDGIYGVMISEEVKKTFWDRLSGTGLEIRKSCSRVFMKSGKDIQWLEAAPVPGIVQVTEARPEQDYVLLGGRNQLALLTLSRGQRTVFASSSGEQNGCEIYLSAHASPSGAFIAQQTLSTRCDKKLDSTINTVRIAIRDASAQVLRDAGTHTFNYGAGLDWTSKTSFRLNDGESSVSFEVF